MTCEEVLLIQSAQLTSRWESDCVESVGGSTADCRRYTAAVYLRQSASVN